MCRRSWWRCWSRSSRSISKRGRTLCFRPSRRSHEKYAGRPTPLYYCRRLSEHLGGAEIYLKREDLLHTGAHKINHCLGQALLVRRMGKKRIIAETGAGQHGGASATGAALFGFECTIYMGEEDMRRQELNVFRMRLLGARVEAVKTGSRTLKDAVTQAMREWTANFETTHYLLGSALGPHPFPMMVRDFQSVIGKEARAQFEAQVGGLPDVLVACVGGGSNAMGLFRPFLDADSVRMVGVEAGGRGDALGEHAARFSGEGGAPGVLHGTHSYVLQDEAGQIALTHSVSAGLGRLRLRRPQSTPGCGTRAASSTLPAATPMRWRRCGRWRAMRRHSGAGIGARGGGGDAQGAVGEGQRFIVNLSGRGDKDIGIFRENMPDLD